MPLIGFMESFSRTYLKKPKGSQVQMLSMNIDVLYTDGINQAYYVSRFLQVSYSPESHSITYSGLFYKEYSDKSLHHYCKTHNVSAEMFIGLLQVFDHGSLHETLN